jgi:hypothetical protein
MADKKDMKPGKPEPVGAIHCKVHACKHNPSKFGFCGEHFDQFKFGLINKAGEHCLDYDKKADQYDDWKKSKKKTA